MNTKELAPVSALLQHYIGYIDVFIRGNLAYHSQPVALLGINLFTKEAFCSGGVYGYQWVPVEQLVPIVTDAEEIEDFQWEKYSKLADELPEEDENDPGNICSGLVEELLKDGVWLFGKDYFDKGMVVNKKKVSLGSAPAVE